MALELNRLTKGERVPARPRDMHGEDGGFSWVGRRAACGGGARQAAACVHMLYVLGECTFFF